MAYNTRTLKCSSCWFSFTRARMDLGFQIFRHNVVFSWLQCMEQNAKEWIR